MPYGSASLDSILQENVLHDWIVKLEKQAYQEDEEVCSEMEQGDAYEYGFLEYEEGNGEGRKGSLQLVTLTDVEPLDAHPLNNVGGDDEDDEGDDDDLNFLGDGFSDS
ncbi:uncharacterized protein LOC112499878 [Cynara cardunculus var. scolymus]|uniref:uncharacterized protein LOC112499878 n=1 Tax=Cynara cardunculus var. scolymus TaxID=59895 RepID=UPI000D62EB58|nr:uncharacterized protein LOC112499878 [Cynara cardunculus var. scolymus]